MKKLLFIMMFLICSIGVFGATSEPSYSKIGSDKFNSHSGDYIADYDTYGVFNYSFLISTGVILANSITPVVGQLDDSYEMEVVYVDNSGGTIKVISYDQDLDSFNEIYSINDYRVDSPITLYDGDGDNLVELYFCGVPDSTGNSSFIALEIDSGVLVEKWVSQIGRDDSTGKFDQRCFINSSGTIRGVYTPVCSAIGTGDKFCFTYAECRGTSACAIGGGDDSSIYKFDANNGSMDYFSPSASNYFSGDARYTTRGFIFPQNTNAGSAVLTNGDEKTMSGVLCDTDGDGIDEFVTNVLYQTPTTSYSFGTLVLNADTMTVESGFSGNGLAEISSDVTLFISSPSCYNYDYSGSSEYRIWDVYERNTDQINLVNFEPDGTGHKSSSLQTDGDEITNVFFGSFNGDTASLSACFIANDIGSLEYNVACSNMKGLLANNMQQTFTYTGVRDLRFNIVTDSTGTSSNLAGTVSGDDVLTNFGILSGESDTDTLPLYKYPTESYQNYINGNCMMADFNRDGFADIGCINSTDIYFGISTTPNVQVDFLHYTPDVGGATMCLDNQSFFIDTPTTGYTDLEGNNVRGFVDCENDGPYDYYTNFSAYGGNITLVCNYNTSNSYTAKICMQDNLHSSDYSQCDFYTTEVSNIAGCESPDGTYDIEDVQVDTGNVGNETAPNPDDDLTYLSNDVSDDFLNIIKSVGGTNQNSLDLILIIMICFVVGMIGMGGHPFVAIFVGSLMLTVVTVIGWLRPVYLLVTIILIVFYMLIIRPLIGGGSNSGGD